MQHLSEWHASQNATTHDSHVMTSEIVMSNESHLYIVMPYCRGGDLCMRVAEQQRFTEDVARFYFRQILKVCPFLSCIFLVRFLKRMESRLRKFFCAKGLETLQRAQICHRDLSPENCTLLDVNCVVIDFGMSLRIPYSNRRRHLIKEQPPCGKLVR